MNTNKSDYEVIDNFLDPEQFNILKSFIFRHDFPWYFNSFVAYDGDDEHYAFIHTVHYQNMIYSKEVFNLLIPLIDKLDVKALIRIKINMFTNIGKYAISAPHVDQTFNHKGAILYLNTNDGHTILEDGTKINTVENRLIKFDSSKNHQATFCSDEKRRVNININYF
jgi:hypothetical protein